MSQQQRRAPSSVAQLELRAIGEVFLTSLFIAVAQLLTLVDTAVRLVRLQLFPPAKLSAPRSIVITGASNGIGAALAVQYANANSALLLTGRNAERLEETAEKCRALGATVVKAVVDVTDREGMAKALLAYDDAHPIDLLVANAGVSGGALGPNLTYEERTRAVFDTNLTGVLNTVLPILDRFRERRTGQIVGISSLSSFMDMPRSMAYSASKSALNLYFRGLRELLRPLNIQVNVVCPGYVVSGLTKYTKGQNRTTMFLMGTDEAATLIRERLSMNEPFICFPLPTYLLAFVLHSLPPAVQARVTEFVTPRSTQPPWHLCA